MEPIPFNQRAGLSRAKPVDNDFPEGARVALAHLINNLRDRDYLSGTKALDELLRTGRFTKQDFGFDSRAPYTEQIVQVLSRMDWWRVYTFCERIYEHVLEKAGYEEDGEWVEVTSIVDVRKHFTEEINYILAEDNVAYRLVDGQFQRRGRAQTQKAVQRVGVVLANDSLKGVREHYNKARKFFDERPEADLQNCVKEAICALEACLEILAKKPASADFSKAVRQCQGNGPMQIPPPIGEAMVKLHAYRGSGVGVAHAAPHGTKVSGIEAELVMSLVASYITYLVDLFTAPEEEIPF